MIRIESRDIIKVGFGPFIPTYVADLLDAFFRTEKSYQRWGYLDDRIQINERPFCYELYHQWSKTRDLNLYGKYNDLMLSAEIFKGQVLLRNDLEKYLPREIFKKLNEDVSNSFVPDLVLHRAQNDNHPDNQKVFVEVKSQNNNNGYFEDLVKCVLAIRNLGYQSAVFIALNRNPKSLQEDLDSIVLGYADVFRQFREDLKKVLVFGRPDNIESQEIYWFDFPIIPENE